MEWDAVLPYLKRGTFLDVGCGAGYAMSKAREAGSVVYGIDPDPMAHGVGRAGSNFNFGTEEIKKAFAEAIPFPDAMFDTVYSSHVLEHVQDEQKSLSEMKRVLKQDGVLIIGMPTSAMATVNWMTSILLTSPHRFVNFFLSPFINVSKITFREVFIPRSHSYEGKSVLTDMKHYRVKNWQRIVEKQFTVKNVLLPALYPYPEFRQWFPVLKNRKYSSSVFFVCVPK